MKFGTKNIADVKYGDKQVIRAYSGSNLVWEKSESPIIVEEYVDLGLSVLWAKRNLKAEKEYYPGYEFAVGDYIMEVEIPGVDGSSTSQWSFVDPAVDILVSNRKTPTLSNWQELVENSRMTLEIIEEGSYTYHCAKCTGPNGNHIIIPLGEYMTETISDTGVISTEIFCLYTEAGEVKWSIEIAYTDGGADINNRPIKLA